MALKPTFVYKWYTLGKSWKRFLIADEQLAGSVRDFFAAGTETTSLTLRWALLYLMHHPEIKQKLQTEIDTVLGGDKPTMEIKDKLPMVDAFYWKSNVWATFFLWISRTQQKKTFGTRDTCSRRTPSCFSWLIQYCQILQFSLNRWNSTQKDSLTQMVNLGESRRTKWFLSQQVYWTAFCVNFF